MGQNLNFSQTVNKLFFGVDVYNKSGSLLDSFLSVSQLRHHDNGIRQWNLNVSIAMKSDKAWSSVHEFSFTQDPLPDLNIDKGVIEMTLAESDSTRKPLNIIWRLQYNNKTEAIKCYEKLKQLFGVLSTNKKFEYDKAVGHIAQFSTRNKTDQGIRDITLFLSQSPKTKKHEISLVLTNELMN